MEEWKNGRMEEWKHGKHGSIEEQKYGKHGSMEVWKYGNFAFWRDGKWREDLGEREAIKFPLKMCGV